MLAAGVASSMAQSNVYSLNVVGYVNLPLTNALTLVANQLDADGTGTNNLMTNVLNGVPGGTSVYKWFAASNTFAIYNYTTRGGWSGPGGYPAPAVLSLNPGEACFVGLPGTPYNTTITTVGQVLQGSWTNSLTPGGFNMVSSTFPLSSVITNTANGGIGYTPTGGDSVYIWDNTLTPPGYDIYNYTTRGGWSPSAPSISVGQGFFLNTLATSWANSFTVQ